ncbi:MAG: hypothetical protein J1G02_05875 [Clostridiales bacterium]|nr:hypothetical protein [Clostridiales bacterium]
MLIVSFNSYKGGACRTTTCYNTLPYLAEKLKATSHNPVIVFDVDLDSMGLTNLLGESDAIQKLVSKDRVAKPYSARHLFIDDTDGINRDLGMYDLESVENANWYFKYFTKVGKKLGLKDEGSVLFCGADSAADTITDEQFQKQKDNPPLRLLISKLMDMGDNAPRAVVFDCASGVQQTTLSVLSSIDCAVMCMRPTDQFRIGTSEYLLDKIPAKINRFNGGKSRKIVLLPTSVSPNTVSESDPNYKNAVVELQNLKKKAFKKINEQIIEPILDALDDGSVLGYELNIKMINQAEGIEGIPEVERFKWEESKLLYALDETLTEQEKLLKSRYEMLAQVLVEK